MMLPERLYRMLIRLYPGEHRRRYGLPMLQHARDLGRDAGRQGRWQVFTLCLRLLKDGLANAAIEHLEGMMENKPFKPFPWLTVLLAAFPGLLMMLSRRNVDALGPLLPILGYLYLGLLVIALPVIWWRRKRFPVWGLLPAGALAWLLVFLLTTALPRQVDLPPILNWAGRETWAGIFMILFTAALFAVLLRGSRIPVSFWLVLDVLVFGNFFLALLFSLSRNGVILDRDISQYFTIAGIGPIDGLMLVAAGLLAARQHGLLALLFILGGYQYMIGDTDFISGFLLLEWRWHAVYLYTLTALYMVVIPVAFLRASTRLGRALALFIPVAAFHTARLAIPALVLQGPFEMPWGDIILSINVLLVFVLAWILYSHIGEVDFEAQPEGKIQPVAFPN